ncbi:uncharacterized protein LOC135503060 [Lineus longissimus]|uniref:uncharacterized protein LOC135503060 n=1 Tax=Lineus longissimus TaxID=88925 RepID=UPI002B4D12AF
MKIAILCLFVTIGLASAALNKSTATKILAFVNNPIQLNNGIDGAIRNALGEKKKSGELPVAGYSIVKFSAPTCGFSNGRSSCTASTTDPLTGVTGTGKGLQIGTALKASLISLFDNIKAIAQKV